MLHGGGHFFQILEGYHEQVEPLFARIKTDHRHEAIVLLVEGSAEESSFPGWWMGFKKLAEPNLKTNRFFIKSKPQAISTSYRAKAIAYSR